MKVVVTGAAGFLGKRVCEALLAAPGGGATQIVAVDMAACPIGDARIDCRIGTITDETFVTSALSEEPDVVFHLAAVLSGQAEAEFDAGMRVNVDGTRLLLEGCRRLRCPPRFIFSSTVAVYGGTLPEVVPEDAPLRPETSYGAEKAIAEIFVAEYSRRGFVDGIACRVPTVAVRPGAPNSALSSFVSGIIREPVAGIDCVCPVALDTRLWICSPDVLTRNLLHAATMDTSTLQDNRMVNLPGLSVTPAEMLESLERVAGAAARGRVRCEPDARIARIVGSWPGAFDVRRALRLGFVTDRDIDSIVRQFVESSRERGDAPRPQRT